MNFHNPIWASGLALLVAACSITEKPGRAYDVVAPQTQPVRTLTSFSESLTCMDDLFVQAGIKNVVITSAGLPDATGRVRAGTKDMLISAISRMSIKSGAFTYVDFEQAQTDIAELQNLVGYEGFQVPKFYIRGGITQLDDSVLAESVGAGISFPDFELGASKDLVVSLISVDMNVGYLPTRQIMAGITSTNSIAVARSGLAGDAGAKIDKAGLTFNISLNESEGPHQATRTLIELSVVELTGKLTRVPYWRCLRIEQTNPEMMAEARSWYASMSEKERVTFIQRGLTQRGQFAGKVNGVYDSATKGAISRYQAENGLIANGRIDFQLYQSLISQDLALGLPPADSDAIPVSDSAPAPLSVSLNTPKGRAPVYKINDVFKMTVKTSQDSYVYCYYRDDKGQVARIFPNRFAPDPYAIAGRPISIPSEKSRFDIVFEVPRSEEEVLCLASRKEVGLLLPQELKVTDLAPLPVESLEQIRSEFQKIDPVGIAQDRISLVVTNSD